MPYFPPFVQGLSRATGIDPRVIMSWTRAEGGPSSNPLNIGPGQSFANPVGATAHLINTSGYYKGIRASRGNPAATIAAIKASPWDAGHYANGALDKIAMSYGIGTGSHAAPMQMGGQAPQPAANPMRADLMRYLQASNASITGHTAPPSIAQFLQAPQMATGGSVTAPSATSGTTALGKVNFAKGADRTGMKTQPGIIHFADQVAGVYGHPLTIGTGTNHNQYVAGSNRQSDHWTGNAVDIPASGMQLTMLGQSALIAAGMPPAQARKQRGGLYNVNGHQIIFNSNIGGNHYNHLHISAKG